MPTTTASVKARGALSLLVAAFACLVALCAFVPAAQADETVTNTIGGVSYTLPADWEEQAIPDETFEELGLEVSAAVAYTKYDGLFFALHIPSSDGSYVTLEDFKAVAAAAAMEFSGTMLEAVEVTAQSEQGCPTLTLYTDDISFNNVTYALTVKIFGVDTETASDAVIMCSFLPADGVLHENVFEEITYYDEPQRIEIAGVSYEVPAEFGIIPGNVLDFDFFIAANEESGVLFGLDIPLIDSSMVMLEDLQLAAEELSAELEYQLSAYDDAIDGLWVGAYDFGGFPTFGIEFNVTDGADTLYVCSTGNVTDAGTAVLAVVQFPGSDLAAYVLNSVAAVEVEAPEDSQEQDTSDDRGFVISVTQG